MNRNRFTSSRWGTVSKRRGAILMVALVVLSVVGMLTAQAIQTFILMRSHDSRRLQLQQVQELIELGRHLAARSPRNAGATEEYQVKLSDGAGQLRLEFLPQQEGDRETVSLRVVASYPVGSDRDMTATWQSNSNQN